jgi:riboflavin synthase alpha subunit
MFTGIIEELGTISRVETLVDSIRLQVKGDLVSSDLSRVNLLPSMEFASPPQS